MSRRTGVLRSQLIDAAHRPARALLMAAAMIIAAFVMFGTVLASRSTEQTVLNAFSGTPAAVDYVIDGTGATTRTLAAVRAVPGVAEAVARTATFFTTNSQGGTGINVLSDPGAGPLTTLRVLRGDYPDAVGEVAVSERTAERLGLSVGDAMRIKPVRFDQPDDAAAPAPPASPISLSVVGVVEAPEDFGDIAYTTDEYALRLTTEEWLPRIDIRLTSGADDGTVLAALHGATEGTLPADADPVTISTGEEIRYAEVDAVSSHLRRIFTLVGMFVAIAVVAAVMVATSTFRIVFAQRMRQLALLRAIGAGRGGMFRALVAEGAITGFAAGLVGVLAATGLGLLLPPLLRALGPAVATPEYPLGWAVGVVFGTALVTVLAVLAPAVTAARVAPLEALRTASVAAGQRGINAARAVAGVLLAAAAIGTALLVYTNLPGPDPADYDASSTLLTIVASGTLAYGALVALGPLLVRPALAALGWPLRQLGPVGRLAVGGVGSAPRRAAAVSVVVALGVTLVAGALVGGASLREIANRELAGQAPADLQVLAADGSHTALPAGFVDQVRATDEVNRVVPYRSSDEVQVADVEVSGLSATDLNLRDLATWEDFAASTGTVDPGPGRLVLLRFLADEAGVRPGDIVTITNGDRSIELRLAGTLENTPVGAGILVDAADLDRLGVASGPTGLLADVTGDGEQARSAAVKTLRGISGAGLQIGVLADLRDETASNLNTVLVVLLSLLGLTVIVAVVGVATTTALSVVERVRESGLLRAIGMSRRRLRTMLTLEAGLYGLIGATLGLLLAIPYSWLVVEAVGANASVRFPAGQLALVVLTLAAATALAGLLPARRAARVSPVTALGADG